MPRLGPVSRRDLVVYLRRLGFDGPYSGGRHQLMIKGSRHVILPNPHRDDVSRAFLARILKQASITREEWGWSDMPVEFVYEDLGEEATHQFRPLR